MADGKLEWDSYLAKSENSILNSSFGLFLSQKLLLNITLKPQLVSDRLNKNKSVGLTLT